MPRRLVFEYLHSVAKGLDVFAQNSRVHHDIKPDNILLFDILAVIGDLTTIRKISGSGLQPSTNHLFGTLEFTPPESLPIPYRQRCYYNDYDRYSFGVMWYALRTGKFLFVDGFDDRNIDEIYRRKTEGFPSLEGLDKDEQEFVRALCHRERKRRYKGLLAESVEKLGRSYNPPPAPPPQTLRDLPRIAVPKPQSTWRHVVSVVMAIFVVVAAGWTLMRRSLEAEAPHPAINVLPEPGPDRPPVNLARTATSLPGYYLRLVPAADFMMGCKEFPNASPHPVRLSSYHLGESEVTEKHFALVMKWSPENLARDRPASCITYFDALNFCNELSRREGLEPQYGLRNIRFSVLFPHSIEEADVTIVETTSKPGYRLPSEAQFEYAALAGSSGPWCFGSDEHALDEYAWHFGNAGGEVHDVMTRRPNRFGLYDLHGNVSEYCEDRYGPYPTQEVTDPRGSATDARRAVRGGNVAETQNIHTKGAHRNWAVPHLRENTYGFRIARSAAVR
jgi:sulfatase modifying factor 1